MAESGGFEIVRTVTDLRARIAAWRKTGESVGLVPTMGALHEGHISLIRRVEADTDRTCVTLFVNPRQFGPKEDFTRYPRDEATDAARLDAQHVDLLFAPTTEEMYPQGSVTQVSVPGLGDILEGAARPGFFTGVATIVTKLLIQAAPDVAVFGEKDYQQLLVIRRLVGDLDLPVRIIGSPTIREADGLAISSRNAYLTTEERVAAPTLYDLIQGVAKKTAAGADAAEAAKAAREALLAAGFSKVDYLEVRDAETLSEALSPDRPARVLVAAWLGNTRLIDNVPV